jgi:dihydrofolate reductase
MADTGPCGTYPCCVSGIRRFNEETAMSQAAGETPASSLMVDLIISLDGYASAEGWPGWWGLEGPEYLAWLEEEGKKNYTFLLGANTYRLMSGMSQEAAAGDSGFSDNEGASLTGLAAVPKVVFSSTLKAPLTWPNSQLVAGDAVETVAEMKRSGSAPLSTLGSLSLCRSLLTAGLVDRFRLVVFPVITGRTGSERIYDGYPDVALDMVDSRTFDGRLQLLEYVPTVLSGPPGPRIP